MDASQARQLAAQALDRLAREVEVGRSDRLKDYLAMLARFHHYSWGNILLIGMQFPAAQRVAGYRAWQRLGRQVRRGERAIRILAPVVRRGSPDDEDDEAVVAFQTANVFDVSQTEGKRLPSFAEVRGDPGVHLDRLRDMAARKGIQLAYSGEMGAAEGLSGGGRIVLRTGLEPAAELSVMAHELAHEMLHSDGKSTPGSRTVRETEAEAVAFVVCEAMGLDTNSAASDYIQLYQGTKETLAASLHRIQRVAAEILGEILSDAPRAAARGAGLPSTVGNGVSQRGDENREGPLLVCEEALHG